MLRKRIRNLVPYRLGADENVFARPGAWITIHGSHHNLSDHPRMCTSQRRATFPAEASGAAGRGFVALDKLFAGGPAELPWTDNAPGCECSPVRLPANRAVAVSNELERTSDFVGDGPTKATSLYRHAQTSNTSVRPTSKLSREVAEGGTVGLKHLLDLRCMDAKAAEQEKARDCTKRNHDGSQSEEPCGGLLGERRPHDRNEPRPARRSEEGYDVINVLCP